MQRFLLLALLALPCLANAAEFGNSPPPGIERSQGNVFSRLLKDTPLPRPEEQAFTKPDPKALQKWQTFNANYESRMNKFEVALDGITIGTDNIVRYAVAVTSQGSQVRNVSYEGIDCKTSQYRGYAYLSGDKWQELSRNWEPILKDKRNGYQYKLAKEFCWAGAPSKIESIIDSMTNSSPLKMVH